MKGHILLEKAYVYDDEPMNIKPEGCSYDRSRGLWIIDSTGEIMMTGKCSQKMQSKKCDVETGEDQKGE